MAFVKLDRNYFNNPLWKEDRIYSRSEAWLDLIASALIEDLKVHIKGQDIEVQRGEVAASRRYLEKRWKWGSTKVNNFMTYLKKNGMIKTRQTSGQTIIRLVKFEVYNGSQTSKQTTGKPAANQSKELKERKEIFLTKVKEYSTQHDSVELIKFFEYWSEHKETGRKMKFEMQKTWNLEMRIKKWFYNKNQWSKEKTTTPKKEKITAATALENAIYGDSGN